MCGDRVGGRAALLLATTLAGLLACPEQAELESTCLRCHRPDEGPGLAVAHLSIARSCVDCHGGDLHGATAEAAHVASPTPGRRAEGAAQHELETISAAYLRFVNPSDPRASAASCASEPGCHQAIVEAAPRSLHATIPGLVHQARHLAGIEAAARPTGSVVAVEDPDHDPARADTVPALRPIAAPALDGIGPEDPRPFVEHALAKACTSCHLGRAEASTLHHASGCAACHMVYGDAELDPGYGARPREHTLVRSVPDAQCARCHNGSLRIGTQYRGLRERVAGEEPGRAAFAGAALYGKPPGFYIVDDNTQNAYDETPPDVHHERGLGCVDCHLGAELHGTGRIATDMAAETSVECEDCHGRFDREVAEVNGAFRTSGGARLERMRRAPDGSFSLLGALDGVPRPVTQIAKLRPTPRLAAAHDAARHGELECYACHTAWMQQFYDVDRRLDLRASAVDPLSGARTPGAVSDTTRRARSAIHLGLNGDGKIGTFQVENALFELVAPCEDGNCDVDAGSTTPGRKTVTRWMHVDTAGRRGLAWRPAFAHTVAGRGRIQTCESCHRRGIEAAGDERRVDPVYGFGVGFARPNSLAATVNCVGGPVRVDLTQMIGADGAPVVSFAHPRAAAIPLERIRKATSYAVPPELR